MMQQSLFLLSTVGNLGFHEEVASSLLDSPMMLTLPILFYSLPGLPIALLLNKFLSRLGIALRMILAATAPLFFWLLVFAGEGDTWRSILERLLFFLSWADSWAILFPGMLLVAGVCVLDERRRCAQARDTRFAEDV